MSTLLTPIITQLELDRDRMKILVNGTELDTVQLEARVEKSIAGQVRESIDAYATELNLAQTAATDSQTAANNAANSASTAMGYRDETQVFRDETTQTKAEVSQLKIETREFRDEAEDLVNSATGGAIEKSQSTFSLSSVYPKGVPATEPVEIYPNDNLHFIGQPFDANTDRLEWQSRRFEVIKPDIGFNRETDTINESTPNYTVETDVTVDNDSYYIGATTLVDGDLYAWRFTDTYVKRDYTGFGNFNQGKTLISNWAFFTVGATQESIDIPTISSAISTNGLDIELSLTAATVNNSANPIDFTVYRIYDAEDNIIYEVTEAGEVPLLTVPDGLLHIGATYKAKAQYIINTPDDGTTAPTKPPVYSPWSAFVEFGTNFISKYETASKSTTGDIDVTSATVFRVDGTLTTPLSLVGSVPNNRAMTISVFVQDSGGSITWPVEISWAGGNEPVLGTTWTNVVLFWTGSMWIGSVGAKN